MVLDINIHHSKWLYIFISIGSITAFITPYPISLLLDIGEGFLEYMTLKLDENSLLLYFIFTILNETLENSIPITIFKIAITQRLTL
jgi:hypothetical protein